MLELLSEANAAALVGLIGGIVLGLAARVGRFCTLGAIEDYLYGGNGDDIIPAIVQSVRVQTGLHQNGQRIFLRRKRGNVQGCPPSAKTIWYVLTELMAGRTPDPTAVTRFGA